MKANIIREKSFCLALEVIDVYKKLIDRKEFVLSKQVLRSGTSIGASIRESEQAESRADFIHKLSVSLKEANETEYWIELLYRSEYISEQEFVKIHVLNSEVLRLLTSIIKKLKQP